MITLMAADTAPILVVDDDPKIVTLVRMYLERERYPVVTAGDGRTALRLIEEAAPRLVVLDLMIPEIDGLAVIRRARELGDVPILVLSARSAVGDRILGLTEGADDYLPKPFAFSELTARVRALGRRTSVPLPPVLERAGIKLDPNRREVFRDGKEVQLAPKEFAVLEVLLRSEGAVVSAEQLLEKAWDENTDPFTNVVRVTVMTLRRKLGEPAVIVTVPGSGYRI